MPETTFSPKAYAKLILHAAKYPQCAINGLLLADATKVKDSNKHEKMTIVDAVPLFHQCLHLSPMAEIALTQVEAFAQAADLMIVGYYAACENFFDNTIDKAPAVKIAEKIAEMFPAALFVMIDNKKLSLNLLNPALIVAQHHDGKWTSSDSQVLFEQKNTLDLVSQLMQSGAQKDLIDFDNHLDDICLDWGNNEINSMIEKVDRINFFGSASRNAYY